MSVRGKNINVFLMDGEPTKRIKCTLSNWTGVAYKIPRTELEKCKNIETLKQSGVYFLFGVSDETGDDIVYIGKAGERNNGEGILERLREHNKNIDNKDWKDYWAEAVVFTTSNHSFGQTEISYLEHRFYELSKEVNRYTTKNSNSTNPGNITEEKETELEEFIDYSKIIMGTLGYKIFEPLIETKNENQTNGDFNETEEIFYLERKTIKSGGLVKGICKETPEGFVVLKGSKIDEIDSDSIPESIREIRKKAKIVDKILQEDKLFKSPSYAAIFVLGASANGLTEWKNKEGKTLKEIKSKE